MNTFQIASDLHIDDNGYTNIYQYISPAAPNLILAGDIGSPLKQNYFHFLNDLCNHFKRIFLIVGNHELHSNNPKITVNMILRKIDDFCHSKKNIMFLNNRYFYDKKTNIRIVGTTLWSYCNYNNKNTDLLEKQFGDYNNIFIDIDKKFNVRHSNNLFLNNVSFIKDQIIESVKNDQKLLLITHHTPLKEHTSDNKYINHFFSCCYSTNLSHLLSSKLINTWIFGHTHYNVDFKYNNQTRIVSNQLGNYPKNNDYKKNYVITII